MRALITWGGWPGHEPDRVADLFREMLEAEGATVTVTDTLDAFDDPEGLRALDLIVPVWTMGELTRERATNVSEAVARGVGLAGCHGGMCDAFRDNPLWQFMTGGNWVAHPGGDGVTLHGSASPTARTRSPTASTTSRSRPSSTTCTSTPRTTSSP